MNPPKEKSKPQRGIPPQLFVDDEWLGLRTEDVIDPKRPIVDPHHHLWHRASPYLLPELLQDINCGHHIRGTVYVECSSMYRANGDPRFQSVGEVEYANGVAASFASGHYGPARACAGIVAKVDLTLGAFAEEVMQEHLRRAPDRLRGIRHMAAWDATPEVNVLMNPPPKDLLLDRRFREGFSRLSKYELTFDAWVYHPQLPQLIDLVDAFPETKVIVDHAGGLALTGPYAMHRGEAIAQWSRSIKALARRPNVMVKIGGFNSRLHGSDFIDRDFPPDSLELARSWKPYVETCIEAFGSARSMFESNFPPDKCGCSARVLWNTFKRLTDGYSEAEKSDLFAGTAIRAYRLPESLGQSSKT
ncbi:amidohydrolase family protein [Ramlibacter sp. 2FC]|uniref:amidohydrolase family protein n=1 Tax=Ramlibacter sp. 2FC TaxID=2502188 RepID=UPI00201DCE50|nr:amidohydrolase family protein [Ramlibacter sp. 2FC]